MFTLLITLVRKTSSRFWSNRIPNDPSLQPRLQIIEIIRYKRSLNMLLSKQITNQLLQIYFFPGARRLYKISPFEIYLCKGFYWV